MSLVAMIAQALLLFVELLAIFSLIGYGIVALLLPDMDGYELLLVPAVGWAVTSLVFQWFNSFLTTPVLLLVLLVGMGALSLGVGARDPARLRRSFAKRKKAIAFTLSGAIVAYLGSLAFVFHARLFALDGISVDGLLLYIHVAEFLKTHTFSLLTQVAAPGPEPADFSRQLLGVYHDTFPGIGQMDAAVSVLTRWPVYRLIELLDAFCLAITLPGLYVFFARGLALPRRVAAVATVLAMTNQLLFWVIGMDFVQHAHTIPLVPVFLFLVMDATCRKRKGAAILVGVIGAAVIGLYLPIFTILLIGSGSFLLATLFHEWRRHAGGATLRYLLLTVACGFVGALPNLYALIATKGFGSWLAAFQTKYPGALISTFYPMRIVLGVNPLSGVTISLVTLVSGGNFLLWPVGAWTTIGTVLAIVTGILLLLGVLTFISQRRIPELALFMAIIGYLVYLRTLGNYPYGFLRAVSYAVPLTSGLMVIGALEFPKVFRRNTQATVVPAHGIGLAWSPRFSSLLRSARIALSVGLGAIVLAQFLSAVELEHTFMRLQRNDLAPAYESLAALPHFIPVGTSVYMHNDVGNAQFNDFMAAYFLPDRKVTIQANPVVPLSAQTYEEIAANGFAPYDYVLLPTAAALRLSGDVRLLWQNSDNDLVLYQRTGPQVCFLAFQPMVEQYVAQISDEAAMRGVPITDPGAHDALGTLLTLFLEASALQHAFATPTTLNVSALLSWAVSNNGFPQLADARPVLSALVGRLAPTPGIAIPLHPPCP